MMYDWTIASRSPEIIQDLKEFEEERELPGGGDRTALIHRIFY